MEKQESFDDIFKLMESAFPVSEIRTYEGQRGLLTHPNYQIHVNRDEGGDIRGFLASWNFSTFRFVEHIAVNAAIRGGGIGKQMLTAYISSGTTPVVLEVEPPDTHDAQRRIEFYRRCGFHLNLFPYEQPPLRKGQPNLPLHIMSYPNPLTENEFHLYKNILYTEVYGQSIGSV